MAPTVWQPLSHRAAVIWMLFLFLWKLENCSVSKAVPELYHHWEIQLHFFLPPQCLSESSFRSLLVKEKLRDLIWSLPITSVFVTSSRKGSHTIWVYTLHRIPLGGWIPQKYWMFSMLFFFLILGLTLMHTWYFRSYWLAAGKQLATWRWMAGQSAPLKEMHCISEL